MVQMVESVDEQSQIIRVLDAIQQIANVTVGEFDIKKLAQQVVETLTRIINAEASSIFLLDEEKRLLKMIAGTGYWTSLVDKATYQVGEGCTGTIATGKVIITRMDEDHSKTHPEWKGKYDKEQWGNSGEKCWSFLGVPLKFKDRIVGVLKVENKKEGDNYVDFTLQDQRIVEILASHIAAVIENTKLYEGQQLTIINTLDEVAKGIQGLNEINIIDAQLDEVLRRIVEGALKLLNAKFCHLRLLEGEELIIRAITGVEEWKRTVTKVGEGITGMVVKTGEIFRKEDVEDWENVKWEGRESLPYLHWKQANKYGLKACCIMPLKVRDEQGKERILGTLNTYLDRPRFSEVEFEMLKVFTSQAAIAISIAKDIKEKVDMERRLSESEKMAAIGRFGLGVTHGIKNPLNTISLSLGRLKGEELRPYKKYIDNIHNQVDAMVKIVDTFSRLSKPQIKPGVEIDKVIDEILQKMPPQNNITVSKIFDSIPKISCDADQLKQVFENIISNVYEAMLAKGGRLNIKTLVEDRKIKIVFEDTGQGISSKIIDQIFDPFYTTKDKGMGLGLYISQFIVQNHNGKIDVESKEGKGTTFTITFPI